MISQSKIKQRKPTEGGEKDGGEESGRKDQIWVMQSLSQLCPCPPLQCWHKNAFFPYHKNDWDHQGEVLWRNVLQITSHLLVPKHWDILCFQKLCLLALKCSSSPRSERRRRSSFSFSIANSFSWSLVSLVSAYTAFALGAENLSTPHGFALPFDNSETT